MAACSSDCLDGLNLKGGRKKQVLRHGCVRVTDTERKGGSGHNTVCLERVNKENDCRRERELIQKSEIRPYEMKINK